LLTLHALHALREAEIILHDALVPGEILSLAPQARLEAVGKRAGGRRTPQLRINQRLIALARQGLRVMRLKGGDPLIFGRGGEEAQALAAAGIRFRIVPGISAGIGGTAAAGIPLTHRGLTRNVTFATGHDAGAGLAHATQSDVLVLYMAAHQLGSIAARLIAAGRDPGDAVALIQDATRPEQTVQITTLAEAVDQPAATAPTLIVIGPVVTVRERLVAWQQTAPMTVIHEPQQARAAG
jgi:uroporphyrin-III C-methyltransferase